MLLQLTRQIHRVTQGPAPYRFRVVVQRTLIRLPRILYRTASKKLTSLIT